MTLNQLRYFCAASRHHSITKAAKELFVTQPTVSTAIRELEEEFNIVLFARVGGRLELTAEGEIFLDKANRVLQFCVDIESEYKDVNRVKPPIRIGIPPMLSTVFFPELLDAFNEACPETPVILEEYGSARACDLVFNDYLDMALVNMSMPNIDRLNHRPLFTSRLVYCVGSKHRYAHLDHMTMDLFDGERIILFNADSVQNQLLMTRFDAVDVHPSIIMRSSQIPTILKFIVRGDCGFFLYEEMLPNFPDCIGIPLDPPLPVDVGMVWKKGKYTSPEMQRLIRFVEDYYR